MTSSPTPLETAPAVLGGDRTFYLKREDAHELGAFKWRGALPVLRSWQDEGIETVVTASTGNHGAATAWAARRLGMQAIVFTPPNAARAKIELIERLGAEVRRSARDFDEAKAEAAAYAAQVAAPLFEDGAEPAQYDGYRTIARELLAQLDSAPGAIVVPLGNGALLGGIGLELRDSSPVTLCVGVQSRAAPVMVESWRVGRPLRADRADTFADGIAVRVAIPLAVDILGDVVDRMELVSERAIAQAVGAYARAGIRAEGAAAAPLAALPELADVDDPLVLVVSGRNIDDELWHRACERPESFPG